MKKWILILSVILLSFANYVYADDFHWECLTYDESLSGGYTCENSCCITCVKDGFTRLFNYCYSQAPCSCDDDGGGPDSESPEITVNSPTNDETFPSRRVIIDVDLNERVSLLEMIDNGGRRPSTLCRNCNTYNDDRSFSEGFHHLLIRAVDSSGNEATAEVDFFIDSDEPKIRDILPEDETYVSGTLFSVEYDEENLKNVTLTYGPNLENQVTLENCLPGRRQVCSIDLDLTSYDGQTIQYFFTISDAASSIDSDVYTLFVDATTPVISLFSISNDNPVYDTRKILLDIFVDEIVKLEYSDNGNKFKRLCKECQSYNKVRSFRDGQHNLIIQATDKAGNSAQLAINFVVDTRVPKIYDVLPEDDYATGQFSVEYTEVYTKEVTLFYSASPLNSITRTDCPSGKKVTCPFNINLTEFDGKELTFYFTIKDEVNTKTSKQQTALVDLTFPEITLNSPIEGELYEKYVNLDIEVSEEVELEYSDNAGRFRRLCRNCDSYDRRKSFRRGIHNLVIQATDPAGNAVANMVSFNVDY